MRAGLGRHRGGRQSQHPRSGDDDDRTLEGSDLRGSLDRRSDGRRRTRRGCENGGGHIIRHGDHGRAGQNVGVRGESAGEFPAPAHPFMSVPLQVDAFLADPPTAAHAAAAGHGDRPHDALAERHPVSVCRLGAALPERDDPPHLLVAEDQRCRRGAVAEHGVHIGPAHGCELDLDQHVARRQSHTRHRDRFVRMAFTRPHHRGGGREHSHPLAGTRRGFQHAGGDRPSRQSRATQEVRRCCR